MPGQHELGLTVPWGGTSHPVWFKNDPRVANVKVAGGVMNLFTIVGLTAFVLAERILPFGETAGRVSGALLVALGVSLLIIRM